MQRHVRKLFGLGIAFTVACQAALAGDPVVVGSPYRGNCPPVYVPAPYYPQPQLMPPGQAMPGAPGQAPQAPPMIGQAPGAQPGQAPEAQQPMAPTPGG